MWSKPDDPPIAQLTASNHWVWQDIKHWWRIHDKELLSKTREHNGSESMAHLERSVKAYPSTQFSTNEAPCLWVTNWPSRSRFSMHFWRAVFHSRVLCYVDSWHMAHTRWTTDRHTASDHTHTSDAPECSLTLTHTQTTHVEPDTDTHCQWPHTLLTSRLPLQSALSHWHTRTTHNS